MPLNHEVIKKRNTLLKKFNLKLIKVFDTNDHEDYKDVVLVYDKKDKKKKVLRVGEHRAINFFYSGYQGKNLIIPKIYQINIKDNNKYEMEEFIDGKLLVELLKKQTAACPLDNKYLELLIKVFWEFQIIAKEVKLSKQEVLNAKIKKHLEQAFKVMDLGLKVRVEKLFSSKSVVEFFTGLNYPRKWKFSVDNLILTPDNKIGFVDLARAGKSFWGYDLGWIFWPLWFHFPIQEYKKVREHFIWLENLFHQVEKHKPAKIKKINIQFSGYLLILERIIGAMFDFAANISHARKITKSKQKTKAFVKFLNKLLELTLNKIEN
ncbi:hypothetical protein COU23_01160 [Candidatus Kuenenbacteria bacterium CG10_big_fil_rev_8_21_14_0_10_36_11]|uniref:Aminoglycoside phosphotransferase domain-containing protein n=1 Tax=Candidatus Kuenenbacteria bacterium CG10_big_fil_rev_8_21_14_0_10_36_11 TaxID=1974618 RepID=A0A2M6WB94_9BACT|nr:MAG: hypothetical protein COU23_01160 [Candidatus Kuenenbacteria bacterium CG10_big_fil_rev_8_21_14_0_10_36_11]